MTYGTLSSGICEKYKRTCKTEREREREIVKKNEERGRLKKNECWNAAERGHTPRERSPERRLHR